MVARVSSVSLNKLVYVERRPALVLFTGDWCGDCANFAPTWERWNSRQVGPIYALEVLRGAPEWNDWEIDEIPTVVAYSDGVEKGRSAGRILESDLDRLLQHVRGDRAVEKST